MSETLTAYVISVVILAALALFIPCVELLVRVLRRRSLSNVEPARAIGTQLPRSRLNAPR